MAIFLDAKLASQVSKDILSLVIHRGTACLLDRRLSASSDSSGLDASTCKKMVKAINKVRADMNILLVICFLIFVKF